MARLMWRRCLSGAAIVAVGLVSALGAPPVAAAAAGANPSPEQLMLAQVPLDRAADQVSAAAGAASGLADIVVSAQTSSLTVYWKGAMPAAVAAAIAATRRAGIQVAVRPALHTASELNDAAQRIMAAGSANGVDAVTVRPDGSGLDVASVSAAPALAAGVASAAGVAVHAVAAKHPHPTWRLLDYSPHWAGARITSDGVHACTSGFPIVRNSDGRQFILTAGHCAGTPWWSWYGWATGNNNLKFGDTWTVTKSLDTQYIRSVTGGLTYDGGVAYGTEFTKNVVGSGGNRVGDYVCQSGGYTGIHCAIRIMWSTYVSLNGTTVQEWEGCANWNGIGCSGVAAGAGDSGGPVFVLGSGSGTVIARGLQSYGFGNGFSCTNNNNETTTCYNDIGFVDIGPILSNYGAHVQTS